MEIVFAVDILEFPDKDNGFIQHVLFSDESTIHVFGRITDIMSGLRALDHSTRSENLSVTAQRLPCGVHDRVIGPFFFTEATIKSDSYLDMLENIVFLQLVDLQPEVISQCDGAPPHWSLTVIVHDFLNQNFNIIDGMGATVHFCDHHVCRT